MRRSVGWTIRLLVIVGVVIAATSAILVNWVQSRIDEQITEGTPVIRAYLLSLGKWAVANPRDGLLLIVTTVLGLTLVVVLARNVLARGIISIDGVEYYMVRYTYEDKRYLVLTDVTVTNHRLDKPVSIGVEYAFEERLEPHSRIHRVNPEIEPVPNWAQAPYYPKNKQLFLPLNIEPGKTERGYVAFRLGRPSTTPMSGSSSDTENGELRFVDYQTRKSPGVFKKNPTLFLGGFTP